MTKKIKFLFVLSFSILPVSYERSSKTYTVIWKNFDDKILEIDYDVKEGTIPTYDSSIPTRDNDLEYKYIFNGWDPEISPVNKNQIYTATYRPELIVNEYTIYFDLDGGTSPSYVESKVVTKITYEDFFFDCKKDGYIFRGWSYNGVKVFNEYKNKLYEPELTDSMTFVAIWEAYKFDLTIRSNDENKGTVESFINTKYYYNEEVTIKAIPVKGYVFAGWYDNLIKVSDELIYTFKMPKHDYSLVAYFATKEEANPNFGIIPNYDQNNKTITYGIYPQTVVDDMSTIYNLNKIKTKQKNGFYLYNDNYYSKIIATPNSSNYRFNNNKEIISGEEYWFKCEPIIWNILENNNSNNYSVLSKYILDAQPYYDKNINLENELLVTPNNYKFSYIRNWLNDSFYNSAFSLHNKYIMTTLVDNSAKTTEIETNFNICDDTNDKIYLLSYKDYINKDYGFSSSSFPSNTRISITTDWARARGAYYNEESYYKFNGMYMTRSPKNYYENGSWIVGYDGTLGVANLNLKNKGVRPSMALEINY
ncbi:MAG: DUF6273 domain-containing protein [Mollicutes bacterium]|nr:DUF6273 domain-containing protein [Mollicutes bacterium]MDD7263731.1 DUF6273 domain-containing protein [bacterium]MDY4979813.1 DUF6273 domain-containing protein [Candidatus Onthovivens sp.]